MNIFTKNAATIVMVNEIPGTSASREGKSSSWNHRIAMSPGTTSRNSSTSTTRRMWSGSENRPSGLSSASCSALPAAIPAASARLSSGARSGPVTTPTSGATLSSSWMRPSLSDPVLNRPTRNAIGALSYAASWVPISSKNPSDTQS